MVKHDKVKKKIYVVPRLEDCDASLSCDTFVWCNHYYRSSTAIKYPTYYMHNT